MLYYRGGEQQCCGRSWGNQRNLRAGWGRHHIWGYNWGEPCKKCGVERIFRHRLLPCMWVGRKDDEDVGFTGEVTPEGGRGCRRSSGSKGRAGGTEGGGETSRSDCTYWSAWTYVKEVLSPAGPHTGDGGKTNPAPLYNRYVVLGTQEAEDMTQAPEGERGKGDKEWVRGLWGFGDEKLPGQVYLDRAFCERHRSRLGYNVESRCSGCQRQVGEDHIWL